MNQNKKSKTKQNWAVVLISLGIWLTFFSQARAFDPEWVYWEGDSNDLIIDQDTTWYANENRTISQKVIVTDNAILTIEKGATIKFERAEDQWAPGIIIDEGKIISEGTEKEPIIFTSDQDDSGYFFFFNSNNGEESFFRYATIEKAGGEYEVINDDVIIIGWKLPFIPTARAETISHGGSYPVHYYRGKVRFENCIFNNPRGEVEIRQEDFVLSEDNYLNNYLQVINSNFIAYKDQAVLDSEINCDWYNMDVNRIDEVCWSRTWLKNNWYGKPDGAFLVYENSLKKYSQYEEDLPCLTGCWPQNKSVFGLLVNVEGYRSTDLIVDPVIIVPGITGSEVNPETGQWVLDPILHTYDDLWDSLLESGFQSDLNLFAFPYQWRQKNELSAQELKSKIDQIKVSTGARKVDLVAHSMGGLVARYYIESDGNNENLLQYENDVDQLITLGTPHQGAPKAYLQWEAGEGYFTWKDKIAEYHFFNEAKHNGYDNIFDYIQARVPSVEQLLPDNDDYLSAVGSFSPGYPRNVFLENLNSIEKWQALLEKVRLLKVAGYQESADKTIVGFDLVESEKSGVWADGMPENYYADKSGIKYGAGDGTVPLASARGLAGGVGKTIDSEHRALPQEAQCEVSWDLGAKVCVKKDSVNFPSLLYFNVFSPVDIQVANSQGQRVGKDFVTGELLNEIEGAFYSGFETENEFITVPLVENAQEEYHLLIQGVDSEETDRQYEVEVNLLKENGEEQTLVFSGEADFDQQAEEQLTVVENVLKGDPSEEETPMTARLLREMATNFQKEGLISKKMWLWLRIDLGQLVAWERRAMIIEDCSLLPKKMKGRLLAVVNQQFTREIQQLEKKLSRNKKNFDSEVLESLLSALAQLKK